MNKGPTLPQTSSRVRSAGRARSARHLLAARRFLLAAMFTVPACAVQALLLLGRGGAKVDFARFYWAGMCRIIGLHVRVVGAPASGAGRPVIFVCNHSSWMDIPALGGAMRACFVSKDDVAGWPLVSTIARLGRTIFVSRQRASMGRERGDMAARLAAGDNLLLFPEGTSSDGSRVLPFRSAFFAVADCDARPLIQPVSVVYDRLAGLPVGHVSRTVFAWYGDMELAPHAWAAAQWRGKRVTLLLHAPLDPADFASRKALAQATWQAVADGAAALRQNRPARPSPAPAARSLPQNDSGAAVFA